MLAPKPINLELIMSYYRSRRRSRRRRLRGRTRAFSRRIGYRF